MVHQLRDGNDRQAVANAMVMDEEQQEFLAKLEPGQAAVFYTGLQKASFLRVPRFHAPKGEAGAHRHPGHGFDLVSDQELRQHMEVLSVSYRKPALPFSSCVHCGEPCRFRSDMVRVVRDARLSRNLEEPLGALHDPRRRRERGMSPEDFWRTLIAAAKVAAHAAGHTGRIDASWCYLVHKFLEMRPSRPHLDEGERRTFEKAFARY